MKLVCQRKNYTPLNNQAAKGRKGATVAMAKGTQADVLLETVVIIIEECYELIFDYFDR